VGAEALAPRLLHEMSDGERQKLMIARALAQEPLLMILDEPTAYLDLPRRVEIMHLLRQLAHTSGRAILLSTHDLDLALRTADRLWLMSKGGVVQTGAPEDLVLSGAFECTFQSEGLVFDQAEGTFRMGLSAINPVFVQGDGLAARWTTRALQRAGYAVQLNGDHDPLDVIVTVYDSPVCWQVAVGAEAQQVSSIESVLAVLKPYFA
jgi:iron complex transport system ATP-binding protein